MNKRDLMIEKLINHNNKAVQEGDYSKVITRLRFFNNGIYDYVEDFSPFTNSNYMTEELQSAIKNRRTLTSSQQKELDHYIIEGSIDKLEEKSNNIVINVTINAAKNFDGNELVTELQRKLREKGVTFNI